jgi:dolichyl-phosphate beta-glucosyltransferase
VILQPAGSAPVSSPPRLRTKLSVVIPAYNEEKRLGPTLDAVRRAAPDAEILVSDDGSRDRTADLARAAGARVVTAPENRGKGAALRRGMLAADGDRLLLTDADLSVSMDALPDLQAALDAGADVALGSRRAPGARIARHQPFLRETLGRCYTTLSQAILGVRISDFTCGFKLFTRAAARDLFSRSVLDGWGYDGEVLFLAARRGWRCREVPITWVNDEDTKVRIARDAGRAFLDLLRIRSNAARGVYDGPTRG